jgi:hypothetical protein
LRCDRKRDQTEDDPPSHLIPPDGRYTTPFESTRQKREAIASLKNIAAVVLARTEGAALFVHLDYGAVVIQDADNCAVRPEMRAILCIRDCVADSVGPSIPDRPVSKQVTN